MSITEAKLQGRMPRMSEVVKQKSGIKLDIGGGNNPYPGAVNIDILPLPTVDIVHDLETTPWPLPDECVIEAYASHVLEHINPAKGIFLRFMNELWRVMKPGAKFAFVVPYGVNELFVQDPTHCNPINQTTLYYFDPDPEGKYCGRQLYSFYEVKPWKIERISADRNGTLEAILTKRRDDPSFHRDTPDDKSNYVKELAHAIPKHIVD